MNELIVIENLDPATVYNGGLESVLNRIAEEAKALPIDISTEKGRKEVASVAYKVARSKTYLDDMGKKLGEEAKAKLDAINADRKKARDFLDCLKDELRKPLTDWEEADKARIAEHEAKLKELQSFCVFDGQPTTQEIEDRLLAFNTLMPREWQEFAGKQKAAESTVSETLKRMLSESKNRDDEQAELAKLRAEQAERERVEAERLRIEREEAMKAEAAAKRESDKAHKAKIHNAALTAICDIAKIDGETAKVIVAAIARGEVPNVKISY